MGRPGEVGAHGECEHALLTHLYSCSVSGNGDMVCGVSSADCVVSVEAYWTSRWTMNMRVSESKIIV